MLLFCCCARNDFLFSHDIILKSIALKSSSEDMADQAKLRKRLEALLKKPENQVCCDCGRRGARWASANLGNFFCIECSGIHRNLGVHISFVRSVNLDTWTTEQVEVSYILWA